MVILDPIDYIRNQFHDRLLDVIKSFSEPNTTYTLVLGSILTSNIEDYDTFWETEAVQSRLALLNQALKAQNKGKKVTVFKKSAAKSETPKHFSWKRQLIFKPKKLQLRATRLIKADNQLDINELMRGFRASPLCTVRNRGIYYYYGTQNFTSTEKSL